MNDERVDVLVARSVTTTDGTVVVFDDLWTRRRQLRLADDLGVHIPQVDDLILTKRFGARSKDLEDIRLLQILRDKGQP